MGHAPPDFRRFRPDPGLVDLVEHYWSVRAPALDPPLRAVLVPTGRATVQFCLAEPGVRLGREGPTPNADVLLPAAAAPVVLEQAGRSHYVGIQLTPWGARRLWPDAADDRPTQLVDLGVGLPDRASLAVDDPARALDRWVASLPTGPSPGRLVREAVRLMDDAPDETDVAGLAATLGCSRSTLYRQLSRSTGLGPKRYLAVQRHRRFTDALLARVRGDPVAMVAAACGYCDESHAGREFRRHTGMPARAFLETYDGIARLLAGDVRPAMPHQTSESDRFRGR